MITGTAFSIRQLSVLTFILHLTEQQKIKIMANLTEAREHAMDAESSGKKHGWFGKYKGRINNHLSAERFDLNKESADWHKRMKAEKEANSQKSE